MGRKAGELLVLGTLKSLKSSLRSFMKGMEETRNAIKENVCLGTIENLDRFLCKLLVNVQCYSKSEKTY